MSNPAPATVESTLTPRGDFRSMVEVTRTDEDYTPIVQVIVEHHDPLAAAQAATEGALAAVSRIVTHDEYRATLVYGPGEGLLE